MKLSKNKKNILSFIGMGILIAWIATPIVMFIPKSNNKNDKKKKKDNNQKIKNKNDVEKVIKILEEKTDQKRIIILPSDSSGKIIANNKKEIIVKLKELIGASNLKYSSIKVSMTHDQKISTSEQEIIVKISKGKHLKIVSSSKAYFVKRAQNTQEITSDLNFVKTSLESLTTKNLEIYIDEDEENKKTINLNKELILSTFKWEKGYSEIDFKDSTINIKDSLTLIPASDDEPIKFTIILSKGGISIEVTSFKIKQLDSLEVQNIKRELKEIKNALENLNQKIVEVYVPDSNFAINHNKINIKNAIKNLNGFSDIDFKEGVIKIKDSNQNLPPNNQAAISIILIISKNNISFEVQGFSAKQNSKDLGKVDEIIAKIQNIDILIAPNVSTKNQSEIQNAIKDQLKKENQTLNEDDLLKITTNIKSLTLGIQIEVTLIIKVRNTTKKLKINVEKINLLKNSNITNNEGGQIFQDKFKNLWAMGKEKKLQVLKVNSNGDGYVTTGWTNDKTKGLLNGSNIDNGFYGKIYQDSFGNLWTMGFGTPLQVLKVNSSDNGYSNEGWTNDKTKGLLNGSNIDDGKDGKIFQDSFGNLWAMGKGTKLQVLKVNDSKDGYVNAWFNDENAEGLLKGSNITNGQRGTIFQDSFRNLWAMGYGKPLQVLKVNDSKDGYVSTGWTNDDAQGLLNGSNIINGEYGTIFEDKFKNLWAMGFGTPLQVLKANNSKNGYESSGWTNDKNQELLKNLNINIDLSRKIFQDSFGNLWTTGFEVPLQVLKVNLDGTGYVSEGWTDDNAQRLLKSSNITNGYGGTIFQDSFKNLWAMGKGTKLQVLKVNSDGDGYVTTGWTNDKTKGLLNGSNIDNGFYGTIYQDSFGNLWTMGNSTRLQVLIANSDNNGYLNSWL